MKVSRRTQNTMIKKSLRKSFPDALRIRVQAGQGTAWGWWTVGVDVKHPENCTCEPFNGYPMPRCRVCSDAWQENYNKAINAVENSSANIYHYYSDDNRQISEINADITFIK